MKRELTVVIPNRDRLDFNKPASQWWMRSLQWQDYVDFKILIVDGGSQNYEEYKKHIDQYDKKVPVEVIQHVVKGEVFHKTLLNNIGIKNANTEYVMCTDADMLYAKEFIRTVVENSNKNCMVESRTLYLKQFVVDKIYAGELDPYVNIDGCKIGRIKYRTSPGGCQSMDIDSWNKLGLYDLRYCGWGSEDTDLVIRAEKAGIEIKWLGELRETIMIFHQPHAKKDLKKDLETQERNKILLNHISNFKANVGI